MPAQMFRKARPAASQGFGVQSFRVSRLSAASRLATTTYSVVFHGRCALGRERADRASGACCCWTRSASCPRRCSARRAPLRLRVLGFGALGSLGFQPRAGWPSLCTPWCPTAAGAQGRARKSREWALLLLDESKLCPRRCSARLACTPSLKSLWCPGQRTQRGARAGAPRGARRCYPTLPWL